MPPKGDRIGEGARGPNGRPWGPKGRPRGLMGDHGAPIGDHGGPKGAQPTRDDGSRREPTRTDGPKGGPREHKIAHHMAQTPFFHVFWVASSRGDLRLVLGSLITIKNNNFNKKSRWLELCGWCLGAQLQLKTQILIRNRDGWSSAAGAWKLNYN